jgi:UDP-N-acetylglucosamine diphosphorylase/glucosamine-1-phosphate N-acetyltransferase
MITINTVLFDDLNWKNLLPLTYTRCVADLRIGLSTIKEKWLAQAKQVSIKTEGYLSSKYSMKLENDNLFVHSGLIPTADIIEKLRALKPNHCLVKGEQIIAYRSKEPWKELSIPDSDKTECGSDVMLVSYPWDIFSLNDKLIQLDFDDLTHNRKSQPISGTNQCLNPGNIFLEEGAKVEYALLNASEGPIYLGRNSEIMEGAMIRGSFVLGDHSVVKMGAKVYGGTTIGPWSKVAGEIQNVVFNGYSNKAHDGYLGNSVLGEWCNLGADTNSSNLKNNYDLVKVWNYPLEKFYSTGLQFCGLIMGDHSKCGINTMFNTGTVVGVSANVYGSGFPRNFIPSFSWGGSGGFSEYSFSKAINTAKIVYSRRGMELTDSDIEILRNVFELSKKYRK